jgi:drug/metabolite transporter (DMT)-like permease
MKPRITNLQAIGFGLLAYFLWALSDAFMKLAGESNLSPYEIVGLLGAIGATVMFIRACLQRKVKTLWPKNPRAQTLRAFLATLLNCVNVVALHHLPLALFYITVFTAPMMICLLAWIFLKEKMEWPKIAAIIAGFIGVIIAINPFGVASHGDWIGYAMALISAVIFAMNMVWLRAMTQSESSDSLIFYNAFVAMIFGFTITLWHADPVGLKLMLVLIIMSILSLLGNLALYQAIKNAMAATISQFHYSQLVVGALLGFFIWHEVPTISMVVGAGIIIASGLYIANHTRKAEKLKTIPPH